MIEIFITIIIIAFAFYVIYKNIRNSSKGKCNCGTCSKHCPSRNNKIQ